MNMNAINLYYYTSDSNIASFTHNAFCPHRFAQNENGFTFPYNLKRKLNFNRKGVCPERRLCNAVKTV